MKNAEKKIGSYYKTLECKHCRFKGKMRKHSESEQYIYAVCDYCDSMQRILKPKERIKAVTNEDKIRDLLEERKELLKEVRKLKGDNREHQYGGTIFHANCPTCNRKLQMPKKLNINRFMSEMRRTVPYIKANCTRCGVVRVGLKRMIPVKSGD